MDYIQVEDTVPAHAEREATYADKKVEQIEAAEDQVVVIEQAARAFGGVVMRHQPRAQADHRRRGPVEAERATALEMRKTALGLAAHDNSHSAPDGGIYTGDATTRTYARLLALSRELLGAGWPVIVDAAFLKRAERDSFAALAAEFGVGCKILATAAPPEELRRRLLARSGDASEATAAILERQLEWFEPPAGEERSRLIHP